MLCKSLLIAALGLLAQAGPISKRDGATVLTDLKTVGTDVTTLKTDVTNWTGDLLAALGILSDYNAVKSALDTAITDTAAASAFSTSESSSITSEVSTLAVLIVATLNEIIAKESTAASAGVTSTLLSSIETLKTGTDQLGADLEAKATSTDKTTIASAIASVDAAFSSAIAAYDRWNNALEDGSYFIDADPDLFEHLLRYLRRGIFPIFYDRQKGHDYPKYFALLEEAKYFGIGELVTWLENGTYLRAVDIGYQPISTEISQLTEQLAEIKRYYEIANEERRTDASAEDDFRFAIFKEEVTAKVAQLNDLKLARSIALAVDQDGLLITSLQTEESQARNDRHLAQRASRGQALPIAQHTPVAPEGESGMAIRTLGYTHGEEADHQSDAADSFSTYTERQEEALQSFNSEAKCSVCYDAFPQAEVTCLDCGHTYCNGCIRDLFLRATKDQSLFPPRCCRQPIDLSRVETLLLNDELQEFRSAEIEFSTTDRTYCSNPECGKSISPAHITSDQAHCAACDNLSCTMCKNVYHADDCPEDAALQATLELAWSEGWQRCFSCKAIVQLGVGCYHMTCKCRAEFCYVCGAKWKTCACDRWDEERLVARAEEVVDREAVAPLPRPERHLRVVQMQEHLRRNHECEHSRRFERIEGGGRRGFECEVCQTRHKKYILQCRRCHLRVCEHCRRNRI
ncbi:uncharacterized protein BO97DRAFT_447229 [Aspergillus homomorphus CBS 101889]|uniref:RING-type domain-containing protein n=1 Tax=Aspergillus homomorphus (strain CBS 101889) TaxID=1450537 RepID=A0A395HG69_ASPHC|nr:hypothetical protein BO97DRAFT_447229 [Aspergillus homomorphus CBS 101889]RAL06902.1 hypothetical protein BO97DRAFT_447229 [Aspergillus homomorphus CBS 101889]